MKYLETKYFKVFALLIGLVTLNNTSLLGQENNILAKTLPDSTKRGKPGDFSKFDFDKGSGKQDKDSVKIESNILDILDIEDRTRLSYAWHMDSKTFDLIEDVVAIDTNLFLPHLIYPNQDRLVTQTLLGNLGAPIQSDDFFQRNNNSPFLFSRAYDDYKHNIIGGKQFNVKTPHTLLEYSSGGKRKEAEQVLKVFHTQNVNRYLNFGVKYDYYNAKGIYERQLTRDNIFTAFASYYKKRISAQATFGYTYIRNQENGGVEDDYYVQDTVLEASLIPFMLSSATTEYRQRSFASAVGYDVLVRNVKTKAKDGADSIIVKPLLTTKLLFDANRYTRVYADEIDEVDGKTDSSYYKNFYINNTITHDSVYSVDYNTTFLVELSQLAKFPGLPGLRFWASNTTGNYHYFKPGDYVYDRKNDAFHTNHVGVGIYSFSPYLSYSGSLRLYVNGYRSSDKELYGQMIILPWKSTDLPYIKGTVTISDKEPDIFMQNYFSNHYKWSNNFEKEKWFMIGGKLGADKWKFELGYNLVRIENFLYFNSEGLPVQADGVTVTSAYAQKTLKLGGFYFVNKVLWQANTNNDVLSLPKFSFFSSLYYEHELVKNVLLAQFGASGFYRSKFYADGYIPAIGQFVNQREKKIGDYPFIDVFVNMKWKRTILFFKYEHVNEGNPNNEYFTALHYPANRRVFKFGLSWIFYN
ncbi:MAG: putative porin [Bacteroidales bacterium]